MTRLLHLAAILPLALPVAALSAEETGQFLFAEDDQIAGKADEYMGTIEKKPSLGKQDHWLNAPLTRLDYVLLKIESNSSFMTDYARNMIGDEFEPSNGKSPPESIDVHVGYSEEFGRLLIGLSVSAWTKPKQPMKKICESLLGVVEMSYPVSQPAGFAWHNNALGVLKRSDTKEYNGVVDELMERALIFAGVTVVERDATGFFKVLCRRQSANGPTEYFKQYHRAP